jgi:hypothetical protein
MVFLRFIVAFLCLGLAISCRAQSVQLPDAPQPSANIQIASASAPDSGEIASSSELAWPFDLDFYPDQAQAGQPAQATKPGDSRPKNSAGDPVDSNGVPIPIERRQPQRILGMMPNFRTVSGGAKPPPPGWKYNFKVATHQATDYSTFIILGLTSLTAEGMNAHSALGKGVDGYYAYTWRGFLDKSDGTYLSAWLLPSLLHEDTRYYALGTGHSVPVRILYLISREGVARTYGGRQTPNIAGLGGKVLTQEISRAYYPLSATSFDVLATKFGYSVMRDVFNSTIREFYPDIAAHYIKKHREKVAKMAARDAASVH